jgi:DNA-binding CsgD family transcriptional regulator/tetratricopeptide (TPR) repeat protein
VVLGRAAELNLLAAYAGRAAMGAGASVVVTGEAGVGKSRLVAAAAGAARVRGLLSMTGRATRTDQITPLRPVAEALLDGMRDRPLSTELLGPYREALARLGAAPAAGHDWPVAPAVVAEGVLRALRALAGDTGAVVVVEDLHWADGETLAVLEYLVDHAAAVPVLLLLTARSDEPAGSALTAVRSRADAVLPLRALSSGDVAAMAAACLGVPEVPAAVVATLVGSSAGLPLLVEELLDDGRAGPLRYRDIIAERLHRLDAVGRGVVCAAAVLGVETGLGELVAVAGGDSGRVRSALAAAAEVGLLRSTGPGRVGFGHALARELVCELTDAEDRAELCRRAAAALEATEGLAGVSGRVGELWIEGGRQAAGVAALVRAARVARGSGATTAALGQLRRALAVAEPGMLGELRVEVLETLWAAGRVDELAAEAAIALDDLAGDADRTAVVRLLLARAALAAGAPRDAEHHLGVVRVRPDLSLRRRAELAVVAAAATVAGDEVDRAGHAAQLATVAVAAAEEASDPELLCEALELLATAVRPRDLHAAADVLSRALAEAERAKLVLWRLRALNELGTVEMMRDARGDRLERAYRLATRLAAVDTAASISVNLAGVHVMTDRIAEALAAAEQARTLAEPLGARAVIAAATAVEAVAHGFRGRREEMERALARALALAPEDADLAAFAAHGTRGIVALLFEERSDAMVAFGRGRGLGGPVRAADPGLPGLLVRVVEGEADLAEVGAARPRAAVGERFAAMWLGYAEAVAMARAGRPEEAQRAFAEAEQAADRYPLFQAIGRRLVAEAALQHPFGAPVDWLREAEAVFVARGLHRIAGACRSLLARAGAPSPRRRTGSDVAVAVELLRLGVTAREAEVLDLVGERLSNKDVASRLFLSPRTVEKHVASLLSKTGCADRAALARFARSQR